MEVKGGERTMRERSKDIGERGRRINRIVKG